MCIGLCEHMGVYISVCTCVHVMGVRVGAMCLCVCVCGEGHGGVGRSWRAMRLARQAGVRGFNDTSCRAGS